jgi:glycosyltransferase involved in cell wall biosynthesis
VTRVHQVLSGAGPHDAITTEAFAFRALFTQWGWGGADHAYRIAPGLTGPIAAADQLRVEPDDVLLLHHSAGWPALEKLLTLPNPKLLLYHNVTPPQWLWEYAPMVAAHCATGREQLAELAAAVDVAAADSAFNAAELTALGAEQTEVIPLLIDLDALGPGPAETPAGPPTVIFVGRLSPHKRQDELIRAFALYRRHRAPDARLSLVGDPISADYEVVLRALAESLAPGAVTIETGIPGAELGARYRAAHVFACMSEHEGFCIPLLEAFHFGVPVLARPAGAVSDVVGDAGILVEDRDPAVVAELIHLLASDSELRTELRRRGRGRLREFDPATIAPRLRGAVEATVRAAAATQARP